MVKVHYLVRRNETTTREELFVHWYANHMPRIIANNESGKGPEISRYTISLFDKPTGTDSASTPWDGIAALCVEEELPKPKEPRGINPTDSFEERVIPFRQWQTKEYIVDDPSNKLPITPLRLNRPLPCTRSGYLRVNRLIPLNPDADWTMLEKYWLDVRAPRLRNILKDANAFGFVINISLHPADAPYAGLEEYYFSDDSNWHASQSLVNFEENEFFGASEIFTTHTEFVGISDCETNG